MKRKKAIAPELPRELKRVEDARQLFAYFFKRAKLWPQYKMWPSTGALRRVVLITHGFDDRMVNLLERVSNLKQIIEGLEEIRLVMTKMSDKGVAKLRSLMPGVEINVVSDEAWESNVELSNPAYDFVSGKIEAAEKHEDPGRDDNADLEALFRQRYGPDAELGFSISRPKNK